MPNPEVPVVKRTIADGDAVPAVVGYHVMAVLGRPKEYHRVDVHPLWKDHYRVNVVVGSLDSYSWRIAHSYFVNADASGTISSTIPKLKKCY